MVADVVVFASHIAKYTGQNPYVDADEALNTFWSTNPRLARECNVAGTPKAESHVDAVLARMSHDECNSVAAALNIDKCDLKNMLQDTVVESGVSAPTNQQSLQATKVVQKSLPSALAEAIERDVRVTRGVQAEEGVLDALAAETGVPLVGRNDTCMRKSLFQTKGRNVVLVGRVDGRFADTGKVVEVKVRRKRLFKRMVPYERVQMHAYMILTDTTESLLREQYDVSCHDMTVRFDEAFWADCRSRLEAFVNSALTPPIYATKQVITNRFP